MPKLLACGIYREYLLMSTSIYAKSIYAKNHEKRAKRPEEYPGDAQEACEFSLWMSKSSPVFRNVNVVATSLRASVRCTMVTLMPSPSELDLQSGTSTLRRIYRKSSLSGMLK